MTRLGGSGRRRARALVVLLGVLTGMALVAPQASAHAYVIATNPANGAEVPTPPAQIQVTFDEPVTLASAEGSASVIDTTGTAVDDGSVQLTDGRRTLLVGVRQGLAKGSYIASWSVISADSHPVGGSVQFGYGVPAVATEAPPAAQPSAAMELLVGIANGLLYLGLILALGLVPAALVLGAEPGERRIVWRAASVGAGLSVLASILQVGAQYLWDASAVAGGATWSGLGTFVGGAYSGAVLLRIGLLVAALVALPPVRIEGRRRLLSVWWALETVLALAILGTVVQNGHGSTGAWWRFASTLVHVSAVVAWLGGLVVLGWLVLRRRLTVQRLRRLPLWSRYAATCVGLLALTGVVQGLVQVQYPGALISTTYGYILLVKLVLVAAVLALGLWGNRWIGRQLARKDEYAESGLIAAGQTARLRGRVRVEAGIGAAIVLVSGVLSAVEPAATAYAPTRTMYAVIGPYAVTIEVSPARRGPETFRVTAEGTTDATPPTQSIQLDLGQTAGAVQALPVSFPFRLPGAIHAGRATTFTFVSAALNVPDTGTWTGTLTLVASATEQYADAFRYEVL